MGLVQTRVLPLHSGDRMDRAEFERRYAGTPDTFKAELVDGVVYVCMPVSAYHARPVAMLAGWLTAYEAATPGVRALVDVTARVDDLNEPQPDLALLAKGGAARVDPDGFLSGVPALVVEVAYTSRAHDLGQKKDVYRRHGVETYVVYVVEDGTVHWFELVEGHYAARSADPDGVFRSARWPGLWLDGAALAQDDVAGVLATLQRGLAAR